MLQPITAALLLAGAATAASPVVVGEAAPEFSVTTVDGRRIHRSELGGKRLLVFMWASW